MVPALEFQFSAIPAPAARFCVAAFSLVAVVSLSPTALAQDKERDAVEREEDWEPAPRQFGFEVALTGGYQLTAADADTAGAAQGSDGQAMAGGRLTVNFNRWLAAEGEVNVSVLQEANPDVDDSATETRVMGVLNLFPSSRVRPFVTLGYGIRFSTIDQMPGGETESEGRLVAGGGAKLMFNDRVGLRADALAFVPTDTAAGLISEREDSEDPDYAFMASLFFSLGEVKPERRLLRERVMVRPSDKDTDGDGLPDTQDNCPKVAEDMDGFGDNDGCPETDNDRDGIADADDRCPTQAETRNGVEDEDGCPETDSDADGYIGEADQCPDAPETPNDFEDDDGCPDEVPDEVAQFTGVVEGVSFQTGSANLLRGSFSVLDRAVRVLEDHPSLRLEIRGHTDSSGNPRRNLRLSEDRADTVRRYLISRGIERSRLESVGVGDEEPIADNSTRSGRARNRRTEFRLLRD